MILENCKIFLPCLNMTITKLEQMLNQIDVEAENKSFCENICKALKTRFDNYLTIGFKNTEF